ncbi:MAG: ribosome silencing factor [Rikenellaceae bacterium]
MSGLKNQIVEAAQDKKAKNVVSIDMREAEGSITDWFIVCNADSTTQVVAIADGIEEKLETTYCEKVWRVEGRENGIWVIMDYGDIMVHIFQTEARDFYALEDLWSDLPFELHHYEE